MVRFLKDHLEYKQGDVVDHPNEFYLIRVGVAELVTKESDKVEKKVVATGKEKKIVKK